MRKSQKREKELDRAYDFGDARGFHNAAANVGSICEMQILGEIPRLYKIVQEHGAYGLLPVHPEKVHEDDRKFRMLYREDDEPWSVYLTVVGNIYDNPELLR